MTEAEQAIESTVLVKQLAKMTLYPIEPGKLTAANTLNTLIRRARDIAGD